MKYSAVVSEGLRLGYGVCQRLQRVSPKDSIHFRSTSKKNDDVTWEIPAGTPVGMTCALVHLNPRIFPDPLRFSPERWIENRDLNRYLLSFSKGSRQCLGIKYESHISSRLVWPLHSLHRFISINRVDFSHPP